MRNFRDAFFRSLTVLTLAASSLVVLPVPAYAAGSVRVSNGVLIVDGGNADNSISVAWNGAEYTVTDSPAPSAGAGCTEGGGDFWNPGHAYVDCAGAGISEVLIRTAGGDDVAQIAIGDTLPSGVEVTVRLGDGKDSWSGSRTTRDTVYGGAGNDSIEAYGGGDRLYGEGGRDTVDGGAGNDKLAGGAGPDTLLGGPGNDRVNGMAGNDKLYGQTGKDAVDGGGDSDYVSGGLGADVVAGAGGQDRLLDDERGQNKAFRSSDRLIGGPGRDTADYSYRLGEATQLRLSLDGRANDGANNEGDFIAGSVENITGGIKSDVIIGSGADNKLRGLEGGDLIRGRGGEDRLHGDAGADGLNGGAGSDVIEGWWGEDTLVGGNGRDKLHGGVDGDLHIANDGWADEVSCGGGADRALVDGRDSWTWLCDKVVKK